MRHSRTHFFFTGLAGAGKTTLARALGDRLTSAARSDVVILDGDEVRASYAQPVGFSRPEREKHIATWLPLPRTS